jgi:hypothetical protein
MPVASWLKEEYQLDHVDMITEPGPTKFLLEATEIQLESIKGKVLISVEAHGSAIIAIAAHGACAGNPIPKEDSVRQVQECMNIINSWGLPVIIVGLWVDNKGWEVERIAVMEHAV